MEMSENLRTSKAAIKDEVTGRIIRHGTSLPVSFHKGKKRGERLRKYLYKGKWRRALDVKIIGQGGVRNVEQI